MIDLYFNNTSQLVEYLADGDAYHGSFTNMQRQQVQEYLADGTIEVYVLEHRWSSYEDSGIDIEDHFSIKEAEQYALPGDRILKVIKEIM